MSKVTSVHIVKAEDLKLVLRALDDAVTEIEAMETTAPWYSASPKMMNRLEQAQAIIRAALDVRYLSERQP